MNDWEKKWWADGAEQTLRLDYPLTDRSVVFDVGAYDGGWAMDLLASCALSKGPCSPKVYLFEPLPGMWPTLRSRFAGLPNVRIVDAALSDSNGTAVMSDCGHESSMHLQYEKQATVNRIDIVDFLNRESLQHVDLMSLNVEGHEYTILTRLLETGLISIFDNVQVQFHDLTPESKKLREATRTLLALTHEERYCYPFVWESWRKR